MSTFKIDFKPKLLTLLAEGYSKKTFVSDLIAGVIVGVVALPLAIAFAIASGVKPEQGLYTAVIAGFVIALLGGSRVQISGPTGAFIVVVYSIVQEFGYSGLAIATLMAGVIMIAMGLLRLGALLKFVPYPLTVGFTSGIALIIFTSQIPDVLGIHVAKMPAEFIAKWSVVFQSLGSINISACLVTALSLVTIFILPRFTRKVPGSLVALVLGTVVVYLFNLPVDTIGSRFGEVPNGLPSPSIPSVTFDDALKLIRPAIAIALLGSIESLLSAVVADGMMGTRHRSNTELIAQGIGNIISPIFQGIPATGAIARTATNIKVGGKTPISAIVHSIVLLLIMILLAPLAKMIPMPTLAAILVFAAWNMSERHSFVSMFKSTSSDLLIMIVTFLLTVLVDLTVAIEVGIVLSAILFMNQMSKVSGVDRLGSDLYEDKDRDVLLSSPPSGVEVFQVYGPLFFGVVDAFRNVLMQTKGRPRILILDMSEALTLDASGARAIEELIKNSEGQGTKILISGLDGEPRAMLSRLGVLDFISSERLLNNLEMALTHSKQLVS